MKIEYFPRKNGYISKRNVELFEERVQPCHSIGSLLEEPGGIPLPVVVRITTKSNPLPLRLRSLSNKTTVTAQIRFLI